MKYYQRYLNSFANYCHRDQSIIFSSYTNPLLLFFQRWPVCPLYIQSLRQINFCRNFEGRNSHYEKPRHGIRPVRLCTNKYPGIFYKIFPLWLEFHLRQWVRTKYLEKPKYLTLKLYNQFQNRLLSHEPE